MNAISPLPRHRQTPITIRSDKAARLLKQLARKGRSQAQVIEDALERAAASTGRSLAERRAAIDAIVVPGHGSSGRSRREIEAELYDENGLPR